MTKTHLSAKKVTAALAAITGALFLMQSVAVFASSVPTFSQTIGDGTLSVDIVDSGGTTVASPSVSFGGLTFAFTSQTATGTLGAAAQKIRVYNPRSTATWSLSMAATGGASATWSDGTHTYKYNDSVPANGSLTVNPSVATVAGVPDNATCSPTTGITKGSSSTYVNPAVNSITLLTGGATASPYCRWDMTGVGLSQIVPASQVSGTYTLGFTLTAA